MKLMKRILTFGMALLMTLGLVACGDNGGSGTVQVDFMYGGDAAVTEMYGLAIQEFNKTVGATKGIKIKGIPKSSSINTVLAQQLPAGTGPDVMALADDYFKRYTQYFADLSGVLSQAEHDDFYETIISRYHYNRDTTTSNSTDPLYAVPVFNDATVLYYNKTVLEANGVICISVEAKDLEAFNAGTFKDGNGKTKGDYGITVNVPNKGYYRSGTPFVPGAGETDGASWQNPDGEVLIFNDRIAMNWDEIEDLAMLCTKSINESSESKYGYYSEWWFNYGWSVGGDCMEDLTGNGDWAYSLPANNPNYIVLDGKTYTGIYTGTVYKAGDTLDFKDVLAADKGATISFETDNKSYFNYTVNGKTAAFRDFSAEIANGTLAKLPSIKDAFSRFVYLSAIGGLNVCPYPNQFNGTTASQYFAGGDMALLVEKISNFGNIGKIMKDTWSVAPMPQYKEYTSPSDPSCDDVKVAGKTAAHSLGYSLAINNKADSRIQDAAKEFVKWFATDGQTFLAKNGYVSSRKSDAETSLEGLAAKYNNPEVILTSVQNASAGDWWYMTDNNWITTWSNPLNNEVRYGKKTLEDFLYAYIEATNTALGQYKK
ncbi:MAG: hypothetical protein E7461_03885 [Ruminococcaceae bacterium]|nr:hypothetical protein [Oscillospiraceae bacterium]